MPKQLSKKKTRNPKATKLDVCGIFPTSESQSLSPGYLLFWNWVFGGRIFRICIMIYIHTLSVDWFVVRWTNQFCSLQWKDFLLHLVSISNWMRIRPKVKRQTFPQNLTLPNAQDTNTRLYSCTVHSTSNRLTYPPYHFITTTSKIPQNQAQRSSAHKPEQDIWYSI